MTRYPEHLWQLAVTLALVAGAWLLALVTRILWRRVFLPIARRTPTNVDQRLLERTDRPVHVAILACGAHVALQRLVRIPPFDQSFAAHLGEEAVTVLFVLSLALVANAVLSALLAWYLNDIATRTQTDIDTRLVPALGRVLRLLVFFVAATIVLGHFDVKIGAVLGAAGVASLAVALAAQDTVANMISGFMILVDRPFRVGDRIELADGRIGDVREIGLRSTRLVSLDNRLLIIPNSDVSKALIVNHTFPDPSEVVRLRLNAAPGTDPALVKRTVLDVLQAAAGVRHASPPAVQLLQLGDNGLEFQVVFTIDDYRERPVVLDVVNTAIAARFAAAGIASPVPQREIRIRSEAPSLQS